ncbi:MAG: FAD-dependent oxidoreductase [Novosphingobium sp.]|nr:FAD-dependent oxidoreductase [Novosphingobium sp.]
MAQTDETFDFVIVGSGGGSMCAALAVKAAGMEPLILEKTDLFGGTTAKSGGIMWIPNNRFLKEAGIEDSTEQSMTYMDAVVGDHNDTPGATRERRLAYITRAPQMVDFLVDQDIKLKRHHYWPDYYSSAPGAVETGRTVFAELFDGSVLGKDFGNLRPNFVPVPVKSEEAWEIGLYKTTWLGKLTLAKVALRMVTAKLTGKKWLGSGAALQGRMYHKALQAGVDMRRKAGVERLLTDDSGRVIGVATRIDGEERTIHARYGVLVNAGGFARNQEMRDKYQPGTSANWSATSPGDTGEMIQEMMRLGAGVAQMDEMVGNQAAFPPENADGIALVVSEIAKPNSMVVDQSGERYINETQSYMSFCQGMLARNKSVPAVPSWLVYDSQYNSKYMVTGTMPGSKKPASWLGEGWLKKGNTIEELASKCDIDPGTLKASVERFNGFARKGVDEDFERGGTAYDRFLGDKGNSPSPSMGPVEKGPFFAYQFYPGDVGTYGGVITDTDARVLREDGSVIDGLYATGISTASVMGRAYPGAGASVGPSFVWGYVAATHAMEQAAG